MATHHICRFMTKRSQKIGIPTDLLLQKEALENKSVRPVDPAHKKIARSAEERYLRHEVKGSKNIDSPN